MPTCPTCWPALRDYNVATVAIGNTAALENTDRVLHDHTEGTQQLTRYCLERGSRRPLVVWNEPISGYWYKQRLKGYEKAMHEAGLPTQAPLVMPDTPMATAADFAHAADLLAQGLKPYLCGPEPVDALLVGSDDFAPVTGAALKLLGKQPNSDVLIAGYDNTWPDIFCRQFDATIPIATIDKDNWGQGEELMPCCASASRANCRPNHNAASSPARYYCPRRRWPASKQNSIIKSPLRKLVAGSLDLTMLTKTEYYEHPPSCPHPRPTGTPSPNSGRRAITRLHFRLVRSLVGCLLRCLTALLLLVSTAPDNRAFGASASKLRPADRPIGPVAPSRR